jgi:hypothetical protein
LKSLFFQRTNVRDWHVIICHDDASRRLALLLLCQIGGARSPLHATTNNHRRGPNDAPWLQIEITIFSTNERTRLARHHLSRRRKPEARVTFVVTHQIGGAGSPLHATTNRASVMRSRQTSLTRFLPGGGRAFLPAAQDPTDISAVILSRVDGEGSQDSNAVGVEQE